MFKLSNKSLDKLEGVNPDLVRVVNRAIKLTKVDFGISEGVRDEARQAELVKSGASKTMNSKHLRGDAVDLFAYVDGDVSWIWTYYERIALAMFEAAMMEGVKIEWGGNFNNFMDGPHFEVVSND
jgi:peptidoglycan L-alanyl-D-glutamate endopeptidase CwlK